MATIVIESIATKPIRIWLTFNGQRMMLEYPDKQAMLDALEDARDPTELVEGALAFALKERQKTDTNLANVSAWVGKTITVAMPKVTVV